MRQDMVDNPDFTVQNQVIKVGSVVAAAGLAGWSWSEIASMLSAIYALILIVEWAWKRIFKPIFIRRGWIKAPPPPAVEIEG